MSITHRRGLRIVLSGMMAADPWQGGATWAVLQYLLGLRELGHRVCFVEPLAAARLQPAGTGLDASDNARYFFDVVSRFGSRDSSALLLAGTRETLGMSYGDIEAFARDADVVLNISGLLTDPALLRAPVRVYVDLDPAFNQLWHSQGIDMRFDGHTHFVSVGRCLGDPDCDIPTCGRDWRPIRQPVVLREWPYSDGQVRSPFTTVANWRGYGSIDHAGRVYGQKVHSMREFFSLPARTTERFQIALAIHPGETRDVEALMANRWDLRAPDTLAHTPDAYRRFIQQSKAEFGIAKSGYVLSRCGWFSDRSVCYLASGRPVLAQSTGFDTWLPTGEGLFAFDTINDVLDAIDAVNTDYPRHCRRAREIAIEFFESGRVLNELLGHAGLA